MTQVTAYVILGCLIPWIIIVTMTGTKLWMKVKELTEKQKECLGNRITKEKELTNKSDEIKETLTIVKRDVKWICKKLQQNGDVIDDS